MCKAELSTLILPVKTGLSRTRLAGLLLWLLFWQRHDPVCTERATSNHQCYGFQRLLLWM